MDSKLIINKKPRSWNDGLPIGSGRLAAMVWGDDTSVRISLNNENLWTGDHKERECEKGAHFLPLVREYLLKGENFKATALAAIAFGGNGGISPVLCRMDSYQPAYDLLFTDLGSFENRVLDMNTATATVKHESVSISAFCHCKDDKAVAILSSSDCFDVKLTVDREEQDNVSLTAVYSDSGISVSFDAGKGVSFESMTLFDTDGDVRVYEDGLSFSDCTYINLVTDIVSENEKRSRSFSLPEDMDGYIESHISFFSPLFGRCAIELEDDKSAYLSTLPLEERIRRLKEGGDDAALIALFARYGVYLFLTGSMTAELPLNLQGKWNRSAYPKWNSDYHLNINLQMNYWFSDALSFDSYTKQMTDFIISLIPKARLAAERLYGCRGIVLALNSDYWRNVTAEAYNYAVWIAGAGWFALHFYKHYLHTGDEAYLRNYAYPYIKEAAAFYQDYIVTEDGVSLIMPSQSPENRYEGCGYFPVSNCINSAMDKQICRDTLSIAIACAKKLGVEDENTMVWEQLLAGLPECAIGSDGRLLEWDTEDKIELEKGHRHVSHLYGVYPSAQFTPERNTLQFEAARKSLDYRLMHDGGYTGWSLAWGACLFARFLDGEEVNSNLKKLLYSLTSQSLLDLHPDFYPEKKYPLKGKDDPFTFDVPMDSESYVFQIDGNLGATAALLEALIQCRDNVVYILPAYSETWKRGKVGPVRMEDGNLVSFAFDSGKVTSLSVVLGYRKEIRVMLDKEVKSYKGEKGSVITII